MAHQTPQGLQPAYLNEIALAPSPGDDPGAPPVRQLQIARWSDGRRLEWQALDTHHPVYQWALSGLRNATEED